MYNRTEHINFGRLLKVAREDNRGMWYNLSYETRAYGDSSLSGVQGGA